VIFPPREGAPPGERVGTPSGKVGIARGQKVYPPWEFLKGPPVPRGKGNTPRALGKIRCFNPPPEPIGTPKVVLPPKWNTVCPKVWPPKKFWPEKCVLKHVL